LGAPSDADQQTGASSNLREVTPFEWDRMFYFDYVVSPTARRSAVSLPFDTAELRRQLVFLRNGQVVRNDLLPTNVEKPVENELDFEGGKEPNWLSCDRAAQFEVTRDSFETGVLFFQLKAFPRWLSINPDSGHDSTIGLSARARVGEENKE
jgi:hypothetical protein